MEGRLWNKGGKKKEGREGKKEREEGRKLCAYCRKVKVGLASPVFKGKGNVTLQAVGGMSSALDQVPWTNTKVSTESLEAGSNFT